MDIDLNEKENDNELIQNPISSSNLTEEWRYRSTIMHLSGFSPLDIEIERNKFFYEK